MVAGQLRAEICLKLSCQGERVSLLILEVAGVRVIDRVIAISNLKVEESLLAVFGNHHVYDSEWESWVTRASQGVLYLTAVGPHASS